MLSAREWKPGDVGVTAGRSEPAMRFIVTPQGTRYADGDLRTEPADSARPLVVIDPDDLAAVVRLMNIFWSQGERGRLRSSFGAADMQAALRNLIAPPRPEEPTGLGAVVEDEEGERYVRRGDDCRPVWVHASGKTFPVAWQSITAVKVLSEGWSE